MRSVFLALAFVGAFSARAIDFVHEGGTANTGARFFLETRFSRFFYANSGGNANAILTNGDPVVDTTVTVNGSLPGPFAGRAINCRSCHLVQEHQNTGNRTYADFAPRSPIPANGDGRTRTPRNSIDMVNTLAPHKTPLFLHYDGQFTSTQELIIDTFTGRNFGWHPSEYATARAHIARIVREDNGMGSLAQQYGGYTYAQALNGGTDIGDAYRIGRAFVMTNVVITNMADPNYVSDDRILQGVAALIEAYMTTLLFSTDLDGQYNGSPYDTFLIKNGLPRSPAENESALDYSRRLLQQLANLSVPRYVTDPADGHFATHNQQFQFGPAELEGLKIFLTENSPPLVYGIPGRSGNCVTCHAPPEFTDFLFHNTGAAQEEYDSIHGAGAFMSLNIPGLNERQTNHDAFLPPTPLHPNAMGTFITPPALNLPGKVDLGLWNVFANPDFPNPQPALQQILPMLMPAPAPKISGAWRNGNQFVFSGSNGMPGWTYHVLSATNLALPTTNWTVVSTNAFDGQGNFTVANPMLANAPEYFLLSAGVPPPEQALPRTIALFKTPDLRDLASSDPYFHTGRFNALPDVIAFYRNISALARAGAVRNASPKLNGISLESSAVAPLVAFLRSLNEDYQDIPCPCTL